MSPPDASGADVTAAYLVGLGQATTDEKHADALDGRIAPATCERPDDRWGYMPEHVLRYLDTLRGRRRHDAWDIWRPREGIAKAIDMKASTSEVFCKNLSQSTVSERQTADPERSHQCDTETGSRGNTDGKQLQPQTSTPLPHQSGLVSSSVRWTEPIAEAV